MMCVYVRPSSNSLFVPRKWGRILILKHNTTERWSNNIYHKTTARLCNMQSKSVLVWRFDLLIVLAFDFFVGFDDEFRSMNDYISFRNVIGILVITNIDVWIWLCSKCQPCYIWRASYWYWHCRCTMYTVYISNYDRVEGTRLLVTIKLCQPIRREKTLYISE